MNFFKIFSIGVFFLGASYANAQTKVTAKNKPVDNPAKCANIKEGKFFRMNYPPNLWYMTVKDNIQTEYYNDGKDFIKLSMVFVGDCDYKLVVVEKSEKEHPIKVGDVLSNKVLATQDNYVKIQSKFENDTYDFVLVKVKENKK